MWCPVTLGIEEKLVIGRTRVSNLMNGLKSLMTILVVCKITPLSKGLGTWNRALSFQANDRIKEKKEKKKVSCSVRV